jgi:diguanylate cyclase (GGDEF)-like protein/PAS domain S-box-containing protein
MAIIVVSRRRTPQQSNHSPANGRSRADIASRTAIQRRLVEATDMATVPDTLLAPDDKKFHLLVDAVEDYAMYLMDLDGFVMTWNCGAQHIKGYTSEEIIGQHFSRFFPQEDVDLGIPRRILAQAIAEGHFRGEGWRVRKDGSRFWASVVLSALRDSYGKPIGYAKITRDLTDRKRQEEALRSSERALQEEKDRLQVTLLSIADGVISTDAAGIVNMMNPAAEAMTGWRFDEARGRKIDDILNLTDSQSGQAITNPLRYCLATNQAVYRLEEATLNAKDGVCRDIQDSASLIRSADGEVLGAVFIFQDVSRIRAIQREVAFSATHDSLTLLPNRKSFLEALAAALDNSKATQMPSVLCFLDLDGFKIVNDTAGHAAGDVLLRTVADILRRHVGESVTAARLGGDEFAMIFHGYTIEQAQVPLAMLLEDVCTFDYRWEERLFRVSFSIGVAGITADSELGSVMKQADVACYAAKQAGRNRVSVYEIESGEGAERHRQIEVVADMREAVAKNRLSLFVQKIASLRGKRTPQHEVLLRMHDRNGGMIMPAQFIPAAERYDQMGELDRWVIEKVFRGYGEQLSQIRGLQININVSANSLNDPRFLPFLLDMMDRSALRPSALTLEITETSLINNLFAASGIIEKVRAAGCKVALDDFGAGLCSFSYLRNFKVDFIKIEGSFIRNMRRSSVDLAIVKSINNIAHEVRSQTIAEFVEDRALLDMTRKLDIDFAQGYAVGRPEPIETLF